MAAEPEPYTQLTLDQLMTCGQVAELLMIRESTVAEYARRGLLPSFKVGRHRRFVRGDVVGAIAQLRETSRR